MEWLGRLIALGDRLGLGLSLERPQELFYQHLHRQVFALLKQSAQSGKSLSLESRAQVREILRLGEYLSVDVAAVLKTLEQV